MGDTETSNAVPSTAKEEVKEGDNKIQELKEKILRRKSGGGGRDRKGSDGSSNSNTSNGNKAVAVTTPSNNINEDMSSDAKKKSEGEEEVDEINNKNNVTPSDQKSTGGDDDNNNNNDDRSSDKDRRGNGGGGGGGGSVSSGSARGRNQHRDDDYRRRHHHQHHPNPSSRNNRNRHPPGPPPPHRGGVGGGGRFGHGHGGGPQQLHPSRRFSGGPHPPPPLHYHGRGGPPPPPHFREHGGVGPSPHPHHGRWERDFGGRGGPPHRRGGPPPPSGAAPGDLSPPPPIDYWDPRSFSPSSGPSNGGGSGSSYSSGGGSLSSRSRSGSRSPPARGRSRDRRHRSGSRSRSRSVSSASSRSSRSSFSNDSRRSDSSRSRSRSRSPHSSDDDDDNGSRHSKNGKTQDETAKDIYNVQDDDSKKSRPPSPTGSMNSQKSHDDSNLDDHRISRKLKRRDRGYSTDSSRSGSDGSTDGSSSGRRRRRRSHGRSSRKKRRGNSGGRESTFTKDQRTVFVSQLVMRATERDIKRYFKRMVGCKVNDVILLRDRRSRNHKGCAYVELARIEDVATATAVSGEPPDFQRFPILVKSSEAEKNYVPPSPSLKQAAATLPPTPDSLAYSNLPPLTDADGKTLEAKVYVGGLDPNVTQQHLFALCSQFGPIFRVQLQIDQQTQLNRGFSFVTFRDPKDANIAIQAMNNQMLAKRIIRANWANKPNANASGSTSVTSTELPEDSEEKVQKAMIVFGQLNGTAPPPAPVIVAANAVAATPVSVPTVATNGPPVSTATPAADAPVKNQEEKEKEAADIAASIAEAANSAAAASAIPTVAEARASMAAAIAKSSFQTATIFPHSNGISSNTMLSSSPAGNASRHFLVHNMYNKDEETEPDWQNEIKEDFVEECSKWGKIEEVTVMYQEPGGKIYATFETLEAAQACAKNLHGRWFDKRQLRVVFIQESDLPTSSAIAAN